MEGSAPKMAFGQFVVGPPGAGKTTYCHGMSMFISSLGRKCAIINLDFANDLPPYESGIDVRDLMSVERAMDDGDLGPNGALIYCMEYLLANFEWLKQRILALMEDQGAHYFLFDCPGQVELYTHHTCIQSLLKNLQSDELNFRLCCVQLIDSFYCSQPATFISAVLLVTSVMLRLEMPQVNVLSKVDLLNTYGPLPFNLDFFTELMDIMPLTEYIGKVVPTDDDVGGDDGDEDDDDANGDNGDNDYDDSEPVDNNQNQYRYRNNRRDSKNEGGLLHTKFNKMTSLLCEIVNDYGLVSFVPVNIDDGETVQRALAMIDRANGYSMASFQAKSIVSERKSPHDPYSQNFEGRNISSDLDSIFKVSSRAILSDSTTLNSLLIQEKYSGMNSNSSIDNNVSNDGSIGASNGSDSSAIIS